MKITFATNPDYTTYEHYLQQGKPMIQWMLNRKLYKDPELIKTVSMPPPVVRKY